jgi:hypothetical protein
VLRKSANIFLFHRSNGDFSFDVSKEKWGFEPRAREGAICADIGAMKGTHHEVHEIFLAVPDHAQ